MSAQKFGTTWWGRKWVRRLESLTTSYPNPRLVRGRTLARAGVTNLVVVPGAVSASVRQGKSTYSVRITVPTWTEVEWSTAVRVLGSQVKYLAELLSRRMPENIDEVLGDVRLSIFPQRGDLASTCPCPDTEADPCAHGAAVHYAFAATLDDDPFLLFTLRGRNCGRLLAALRATASDGVPIESLRTATFLVSKTDLTAFLDTPIDTEASGAVAAQARRLLGK